MHYLIDNYDSFTYNLYQLIGNLSADPITVLKNDAVTANELAELNPESIIFSPGPGRPENAGNMPEILDAFLGKVPILGVCLGHQAIAEAYGAKVVHAPKLMHGKPSQVNVVSETALFKNCPHSFKAARYHSLIVDPQTVPTNLVVTAETADGEIMAVADETKNVYGVQFHPESIMTDPKVGAQIIKNFLTIVATKKQLLQPTTH
ncbi:anthranilate synthase component II [Lentilactobacillus farraginis]|uniref:Glutamine amidotransferase of anthranilate synthase or para-aminobenzoate synthase n=1 Tax=Lentilactobacillus farraginis DSM 18382 = JCM 14108 TaxID=1423743 RepID=X0PAZ8_9LACO|nr:aminodeoxychorismate/anthranilate synthase component II [Lentilactobacillus farraginis]KRM09832.1 glutamine amidotransferase, class I [Lentilactobacillus farraginis DSM 18382 = JCM 14108]GAF36828.1 glutamine amidotransferase of anthranilate synthase or para-aminobenzoate synthase [Lentilactobacillus farraginis DSM 18382 = JCM 14108]